MYYLNDEHPDFEYAVYCRVGNACPYITHIMNNKKQVELWIDGIARWHNRYRQVFYIDYSGYKNEYSRNEGGFYYKILKRKVNDWKEVS